MSATLADLNNGGAAIEAGQEYSDDGRLTTESQAELEETRRKLERTAARGVGRMHLDVNYPREGKGSERVPFVRIPINEASEIMGEIDQMQEEGTALEFSQFLTETLEEFCLDPAKDADHWGGELTMGDALGLVRNIAFGGSPPGK